MSLHAKIHNLTFRLTQTGYSAMLFQVISAEGKNICVATAEKMLPWEVYKDLPEPVVFYPEMLHAITPQLDIMMRCVNLEKLLKVQNLVNSLESPSIYNKYGMESILSGFSGNDDSDPKIEMLYSPKPNKERVPEKEALLRIPTMLVNNGVISKEEGLDFARKIEQVLH